MVKTVDAISAVDADEETEGAKAHAAAGAGRPDRAMRLRRYCLNQHTTYNVQTQAQQDKAIRWQHIKGVMGSSLGALSASLNIGIAKMFVSSGAGLALTGGGHKQVKYIYGKNRFATYSEDVKKSHRNICKANHYAGL